MAELAVVEKEKKLEIFKKDSEELGQSTADFIDNFYPSYGVDFYYSVFDKTSSMLWNHK